MSFLVVGSTGFVGGEIVRRLQQRDQTTRALVRGGASHPKAQSLSDAGAEIVDGDLTRPETLDRACRDVDAVITTATAMPSGANDGLRRVDHQGTLALISAAERAGVKKFIYTSYSGNIREDSPLETAKRACEGRLLQSHMRAVILRPSYFMEMWLSPMLGFDPLKGAVRIYGTGEAKINYVSAFDVAEFAVAAALKDRDGRNGLLEMGGPEALSQLDAVGIFEQMFGKIIKLEYLPVEALEQQHHSSDPLQKTFAALMLGYANGDVVSGARSLADQYGVRLRSVADYAHGFRSERVESVA
jgi:uncharacterized protein YbjT (DUF2867 family)